MPTCFTCGNEYDRTFTVITHNGTKYEFDCLECAIQELAPACTHCGCRVIGHGIERHHDIYCCENCARHESAAHQQALHSEDDIVDEASTESFPASDPPGWINSRSASSRVDQKP